MSESNTDAATTDTKTWTEGLTESQLSFVTEKGYTGLSALVDAVPKEAFSWKTGLSEDQKGLVESKGFEKPSDLISAFGSLEKLKGVPHNELLRIPNKSLADDPEAWNEFYAKSGRPKTAEEYEIPKQEGENEKLMTWARDTFHSLGLSKVKSIR